MSPKRKGPVLAIFQPKDRGDSKLRKQGILTLEGNRYFEKARAELKALVGWSRDPSDGDTIEYLARKNADPAKLAEYIDGVRARLSA